MLSSYFIGKLSQIFKQLEHNQIHSSTLKKRYIAEIIRNRTIRPSSRLESSVRYKIDTKAVERGDTLIVNIDHESEGFKRTYRFNGRAMSERDSIHFKVDVIEHTINISWSGAQPIS